MLSIAIAAWKEVYHHVKPGLPKAMLSSLISTMRHCRRPIRGSKTSLAVTHKQSMWVEHATLPG